MQEKERKSGLEDRTSRYHDMGKLWRFTPHTFYYTCRTPRYKTMFFAKHGDSTHRYMLELILLSAIQTIASIRLSSQSHWFWVWSWGIGNDPSQLCPYSLNKVRCLRITHSYNAFPFITFDYAFHRSLAEANPYMNFSHGRIVHHQLQHSLVMFLNIDICFWVSIVICVLRRW